jgi:amidohydrolase family protein
MTSRRAFLKTVAALPFLQIGAKPGKRRELSIAGRRVKTVDAHAHCFVPEVGDLVKDTPLAAQARNNLTGNIALGNPQRLIDMDAQGIDYQVINVNAWGYSAERALARDLVKLQNEKISEYCAKHPDRFVGMATLALQHPDLAADQLDEAVKKLGLRGAAIGGSVEGQELSDRKFDPFWAKAEQLGVLLFMHPQNAHGTTNNPRLQGKGGLGNAGPVSRTEDLRRSCRWISGFVQRPIGCTVRARQRRGRRVQGSQEETERIFQATALCRHNDFSRGRPAAPGR